MNKLVLAIGAAALTMGSVSMGSMALAAKSDAPDPAAVKGAAQLAKLLDGRTAGKPQSCIPAYDSNDLQVIDRTAIVYKTGKTVYVARADDPRSLDNDNILIINRFGSQLCRQDVIRTVDRISGFTNGAIFLGDFVPYTKG